MSPMYIWGGGSPCTLMCILQGPFLLWAAINADEMINRWDMMGIQPLRLVGGAISFWFQT